MFAQCLGYSKDRRAGKVTGMIATSTQIVILRSALFVRRRTEVFKSVARYLILVIPTVGRNLLLPVWRGHSCPRPPRNLSVLSGGELTGRVLERGHKIGPPYFPFREFLSPTRLNSQFGNCSVKPPDFNYLSYSSDFIRHIKIRFVSQLPPSS